MRIIICGSRSFSNYSFFREKSIEIINEWLDGDTSKLSELQIVSGGAVGPDKMAENLCLEYGLKNVVFPANWAEFGKRAGYIRNSAMVDYAIDDPKRQCLIIAFWDNHSPGTYDMIRQAELLEVPIKIIKTVGVK